jgi:hypothetical protein
LRAVSDPGGLLAARASSFRSPADVLAALPGWPHARLMADAYHPLVFAAGLVGLVLLPRRTRWLALVASAATLFAGTLYSPAWTAMSAYPFIYTGAGVACAAAGTLAARAGRRWPGLVTAGRQGWLVPTIGLVLALLLAGLTNLDLLGDTRFLLMWWSFYARQTLF